VTLVFNLELTLCLQVGIVDLPGGRIGRRGLYRANLKLSDAWSATTRPGPSAAQPRAPHGLADAKPRALTATTAARAEASLAMSPRTTAEAIVARDLSPAALPAPGSSRASHLSSNG